MSSHLFISITLAYVFFPGLVEYFLMITMSQKRENLKPKLPYHTHQTLTSMLHSLVTGYTPVRFYNNNDGFNWRVPEGEIKRFHWAGVTLISGIKLGLNLAKLVTKWAQICGFLRSAIKSLYLTLRVKINWKDHKKYHLIGICLTFGPLRPPWYRKRPVIRLELIRTSSHLVDFTITTHDTDARCGRKMGQIDHK